MKSKIKKLIKQKISEQLDIDAIMLSGEDGKLKEYSTKVETLLKDIHERADKLAQEGEDLIRENYLRVPAAEERKRSVLTMVGYMRQVRNTIGNLLRLRYLIG